MTAKLQCALLSGGLLLGVVATGPVMAATATTKVNAATTATGTTTSNSTASAETTGPDMEGRKVDVVVVWGFRVRSQKYDERTPPLTAGYGDLVNKPECQTSVCGFVVFHDGEKWRYTNVLAGTESELRTLQGNLEYGRQTLVIVYPNGEKRTPPKF
jgi:hypothetical protein